MGRKFHEIRLKISSNDLRAKAGFVEPGHYGAEPSAEANAAEDENLQEEGSQKAPAEIVELGYGRGVEKVSAVAVDVLICRLTGDSRSDHQTEETDVGDDRVQRVRRIDQHLATSTEVNGSSSESAARHQDEQAAQSEEDCAVDPRRNTPQALLQLEEKNVE